MNPNENKSVKTETNTQPIPVKSDAHPVGTGVGAAGGAVAGAAIGTAVGGPVGTVVGAGVGAATGALAGQNTAKVVNPS